MRTTVDLPPATYTRVKSLAQERSQPVSTVIAELTALGLSQVGTPITIEHDESTGLPYIHVGHPITNDEVIDAIKDDE